MLLHCALDQEIVFAMSGQNEVSRDRSGLKY